MLNIKLKVITMYDLLKDRILNYSIDRANEFYGLLPKSDHDSVSPEYPLSTWGFSDDPVGYNLWVIAVHNKGKPPYTIWEHFEDGILFYSERTAVFLKNSGHIYKLTKTQLKHDWLMHQKLHELTQSNESIRIEIPLYGREIKLDDVDFFYSEVYRENYLNSINIHQLHVLRCIDQKFMINCVDESTKLIELIKDLYDSYGYGCPELGTLFAKISFDRGNSFSGIWTDFKHWKLNFEDYLTRSYTNILHYLDDHKLDDVLSDSEAREILDYTVKKWKKFNVNDNIFRKVENSNHNLIVCTSYSKPIRTFDGIQNNS